MIIDGLEINSPEYWELRHQREPWPRTSGWAMDIVTKQIPPGASVLEIGCGQGAFAAKLLELRPDLYSVTAIDISPTAISLARESFPHVIDFLVADVFELRDHLKGESYDYIISIQNFEHWRLDQQPKAMHQCWTRLNHGGKFFFTGVGKDWSLDIMNATEMEFEGKTIMAPNDYHYNNWSEQEVYDLFMIHPCRAQSVKFWRRRRKNRVIAEATKA